MDAIGVAKWNTSLLAPAPASAAPRLRIRLWYSISIDPLPCAVTISEILYRNKMPGVPSGRGCDACRKQKKKVWDHADGM